MPSFFVSLRLALIISVTVLDADRHGADDVRKNFNKILVFFIVL